MKVGIIGSTGMLGSTLYSYLKQRGVSVVGISRTVSEFTDVYDDFLDFNSLGSKLKKYNLNVIINVAAITDLFQCQVNVAEAYDAHCRLSSVASSICDYYVYVSTDSVYNETGRNSRYSEISSVRPSNVYALTKLLGEQPALSTNGLVVRVNIYGYGLFKPDGGLFQWVVNSCDNGVNITGYSNVFFNPVSVAFLSEVLYTNLTKKVSGILNVGSSECISKYEFVRRVVEIYKPGSIKVSQGEMINDAIDRPFYTCLDITRYQQLGFSPKSFYNDSKELIDSFSEFSNYGGVSSDV